MSTCKDCLHNNICEKLRPIEYCLDKPCSCFKPKADYVEVVRCKDCVHRNPNCYKCMRDNLWHDKYDFCSYGERKESEVRE